MDKRNIDQLLNINTNKLESIPRVYYMDEDILYIERIEQIPDGISSKTYANMICFCSHGSMEGMINGKRYTLSPGDTLVCPSNATVEHILVSPDLKFTFFAFTDRVVRELLANHMDVWNRAVYVRQAYYLKALEDKDAESSLNNFWHVTEIIKAVINGRIMSMRKAVMRNVVQMSLLYFCSRQQLMEEQENEQTEEKPQMMQGRLIFNKFMDTLRSEPMKHQPVYYYAQKLCVTPKHLAFVCKQVSGKTAQEIIQNAVIEEIVDYLRNSTLTVKEIALRMGFNNISFFGKYVRAKVGMSPNEYRRKLLNR